MNPTTPILALLLATITTQPTPKAITTQTLDESGTNTTFVKDAQTGRYLQMTVGNITTDFLYDKECTPATTCDLNHNGESVHVDNLTLTERTTKEGRLEVEGLPTIAEHETNRDGRDIAIRTTDGTVLATFAYTDAGRLREVVIGDAGRLTISEPKDNLVTEILYDKHEQKVGETTAHLDKLAGNELRGLDPVAQLLGLPSDWPLTSSYRSGAQVSTFRDPHGKIIAYVLVGGALFDAKGKPLAYDINANLSETKAGQGDGPFDATGTVLQRVAPTHAILTRDGSVGIYVENGGDGAIRSIWTEKDDKNGSRLAYRIAHAPPAP